MSWRGCRCADLPACMPTPRGHILTPGPFQLAPACMPARTNTISLLPTCPPACCLPSCPQALEELSLADNELREVAAGALQGLSSLKRLHLFGNRLQALPLQALQELPQLQVRRACTCMALHRWLPVRVCADDQVLVLLVMRCWCCL